MGSKSYYMVNRAPIFRVKEILISRLKIYVGVVIFVLKIAWLIFGVQLIFNRNQIYA